MFWKKKRETHMDILLPDKGMVQLCKSLGMPDDLITAKNVFVYVPCSFVEVYTDGELQTHHAPPHDRRLIEWFGHRDFGEGRFVKELVAVRDEKRQLDGVDLAAIQGGIAFAFAQHLVTGKGVFPVFDPRQLIPSPVRIEKNRLYFGGNYGQGEYCEQLNRTVDSILALEPGIRAINNIDQLLLLSQTKPVSLFQYATISSYPFIARLLPHYLLAKSKQLVGDETLALTLEKHDVYKSLQGEVADVTQSLVKEHRKRNQPTEFLDLVLYTSYLPPRIDVPGVQQLMKNVYQLLRPGGALLVGFPLMDSTPGPISLKDLMEAALSAGFLSEHGNVHMGTSNIANARLPLFIFFVKEGL